MTITDRKPDGTPFYLTPVEVAINLAIGRARRRVIPVVVEVVADDPDEPRKTCGHCGESLPLQTYAKHKTNRDRRDGRCTACKAAYDRKRAKRRREAAGGRG